MKTLTAFLLLTSVMMGQIDTTNSHTHRHTNYGEVDSVLVYDFETDSLIKVRADEYIPESLFNLPTETSWILEFITLWDEYAKECYADSISQHTYRPKWNDNCYTEVGNMEDGYSSFLNCNNQSHYSYIHKEPDFQGFIEFLRSKINN